MNALLLVGARFLKKNAVLYGLAAMIAGCSVLWFWPLRGLMGHYYAAPDWQGTRFSQQDAQITLNMLDVYRDKFPQEDFSIQWEGWIHIDLAGTYTFAPNPMIVRLLCLIMPFLSLITAVSMR